MTLCCSLVEKGEKRDKEKEAEMELEKRGGSMALLAGIGCLKVYEEPGNAGGAAHFLLGGKSALIDYKNNDNKLCHSP